MTSSHDERKTGWAVPFFTIWIGQALSLVGSRAGGFALVWWLTKRSGSGTVLATATMVAMIPQVFLGPFIGALVDRWNRRAIMLVADTVIALLSAWLALVALLLAAIMNPIANGPLLAILQNAIAPDMQGRVFMIVGSIAQIAAPLGLAVAGPVSDALGVGAWFIVGGVASILVGIIAPLVPAIAQIEEQREARAESAESPAG